MLDLKIPSLDGVKKELAEETPNTSFLDTSVPVIKEIITQIRLCMNDLESEENDTDEEILLAAITNYSEDEAMMKGYLRHLNKIVLETDFIDSELTARYINIIGRGRNIVEILENIPETFSLRNILGEILYPVIRNRIEEVSPEELDHVEMLTGIIIELKWTRDNILSFHDIIDGGETLDLFICNGLELIKQEDF